MSDSVQSDDYRHDQLLDHDFDGIQEYDNRLPNWWLWILWGSILFSVVYWLYFHTFAVGLSTAERYEVEMQAAAEAALASGGELDDEALLAMAGMPDRVSEGQTLYATYCVACHSSRGEGLVGPNLTDAYWIHGPRPLDMHRVIKDGVLERGMAAWGQQLGPKRIQSLVAFLLSIQNTEVPGKAPEGELYE